MYLNEGRVGQGRFTAGQGKNLVSTLGKAGCLSLLAKLRAVGFMMSYSDTPLVTTGDSWLTDILYRV